MHTRFLFAYAGIMLPNMFYSSEYIEAIKFAASQFANSTRRSLLSFIRWQSENDEQFIREKNEDLRDVEDVAGIRVREYAPVK